MVKICVVGCLHGELDAVYRDIKETEQQYGFQTDLVLCCGDFQSVRNPADLSVMSIPAKYYRMGDFWRYYAEDTVAPIPTVFVGGNHEASNYLQELPYGGWVARNIWYMGYAGVVQFSGLRIAGLSGIYKQHDHMMGHFEHPPYTEHTKRSAYHVRNVDVFRLEQLRRPIDIVLSHDWPRGIYHYGDTAALLGRKPMFAEEVESNTLGNPPAEQLLVRLKPRYWFAAHLHIKFAAKVAHPQTQVSNGHTTSASTPTQETRFLALNKCLPRRDYLQFVDIDPAPPIPTPDGANSIYVSSGEGQGGQLCLDPEWLTILRSTNHLMSLSRAPCVMPGPHRQDRFDFSATDDEIWTSCEPFGSEFRIPDNFEPTAAVHKPAEHQQTSTPPQPRIYSNPQTELICAMMDLVNPNAVFQGRASYSFNDLSSRFVEEHLAEESNEEEGSDEECGPPPCKRSSVSPAATAPATTDEYCPDNTEKLYICSSDDEDEDSSSVEGYQPELVMPVPEEDDPLAYQP